MNSYELKLVQLNRKLLKFILLSPYPDSNTLLRVSAGSKNLVKFMFGND